MVDFTREWKDARDISCKMLAGEAISSRRWTTKRSSKFHQKNNDFRSWKSDASPLNEELEAEVPCWSTMTDEAWKGPPESVERMISKVSKISLETTSGAMCVKNAWRSKCNIHRHGHTIHDIQYRNQWSEVCQPLCGLRRAIGQYVAIGDRRGLGELSWETLRVAWKLIVTINCKNLLIAAVNCTIIAVINFLQLIVQYLWIGFLKLIIAIINCSTFFANN